MHLPSLTKPLELGVAARAFIRRWRARRAKHDDVGAMHADTFADDTFVNDPHDPVQGFDVASELQVVPLEVDAQSTDDAEAAQDLAGLESEVDQIAGEDDDAIAMAGIDGSAAARVDGPAPPRDAGDLYGAHTPPSRDRVHPDDDHAAAEGQNWIEALETSSIENGADPERELDSIVDDEDVNRSPHASSTRDRPIADYGSGGRRGL
jgi:hypothetical protein